MSGYQKDKTRHTKEHHLEEIEQVQDQSQPEILQ